MLAAFSQLFKRHKMIPKPSNYPYLNDNQKIFRYTACALPNSALPVLAKSFKVGDIYSLFITNCKARF